MGDWSSDLSGRAGGGAGEGMVKVDKDDEDGCPCAKDAASTWAWARESVHVGRDLWNDGDDNGVEYDGVDWTWAETTDMGFGGELVFALYLPLLNVDLDLGIGRGDEANGDKFAADGDAKKYGIYSGVVS